MAWEQSVSASFRARHATADGDDAHAVLQSLERTRERLAAILPATPGELTVVLHPGRLPLALSNPLVAVRWMITESSARRCVTGWVGREEIHVLSPAALRGRAGEIPGAREMLRLSAASLYARRAIDASTRAPNRIFGPARALRGLRRELGGAWLREGAPRWLAGQTDAGRAAIVHRLRDGARPAFPPSVRDAPLLGGTVCALLSERRDGGRSGARAVARLASSPQAGPSTAMVERAFGQRLVSIEGEWRALLARLAEGRR